MSGKSKILVIGGTGYIGKFMVEASAKAGNPTFVLVRQSSTSDPVKGKLVQTFKDLGVNILHGDINDHESLVNAIKQVDVVISAIGGTQIMDQAKIIAAIKEAGNVKRFLPSEFGTDVDRTNAVEPAKSAFSAKAQIRRAVEAEGIPHTYVVANCFAGYYLPTLVQPQQAGLSSPPRDKVTIYGDGNAKAVINKEEDVAAYTVKTVDDPTTLDKILYVNPPKNTVSVNDLVALWESKIGKTLEKTHIPEEEFLKSIHESPISVSVVMSINHSVFVKGDQTSFSIDPSFGFEASELYPDVKYTSVEEYLGKFA
ncbi:PREDICTED: isoflavone reductase homolog P3-like [Tarenaya hassleriana]|uniref:isoflavone reductase homolog P3-like n=1 Tax=Tarenaya hassleriana TaxID=28532 RepID=UPI00053C66D3|nr:PREDICTED: isoflavone reductase homolog P3-like [Tarenaya hassleriana]